MKKIQGTHIHVFCTDSNSGNAVPAAFARQASVDMSRKMIPISSASSGDNEEYTPGRKSWRMNIGCLLAEDELAIHAAYNRGTKLFVQFRDETPDYDDYHKNSYSGYAFIESIKAGANIHDMASFNVSLRGTGELDYDEWEGENVQIVISENPIPHSTSNHYRVNLNTPAPCDIKVHYQGGSLEQPSIDILIRKGETYEEEFSIRKEGYQFDKWSATSAVANHTVTLEEA